jgi:hypothetical protein
MTDNNFGHFVKMAFTKLSHQKVTAFPCAMIKLLGEIL